MRGPRPQKSRKKSLEVGKCAQKVKIGHDHPDHDHVCAVQALDPFVDGFGPDLQAEGKGMILPGAAVSKRASLRGAQHQVWLGRC